MRSSDEVELLRPDDAERRVVRAQSPAHVGLRPLHDQSSDEILDARVVFDSAESFHYLARNETGVFLVNVVFERRGQRYSRLSRTLRDRREQTQ